MINANEQRVIDVANGTFEYEGELYTVRATYLNTLTNEFDKEDRELTSEQADKVIKAMFGNIDRGVREGYLKRLSQKEAKEVREKNQVRQLTEIGVTGDGVNMGDPLEQDESQEEPQVVTGRDGQTFPIQQTPLQMSALDELDMTEIEAVQSYTPNEQVAEQMNAGTVQMAAAMSVAWAVCIVVLTIYLKVVKRRKKAFLVMLGASLMSLSILVLGTTYIYNSRAWSTDTWQTVTMDSDYFKEIAEHAQEDFQKVLSGVELESGAAVLEMDDNTVYRDAKSIFDARLTGKELPKLEKRKKDMRESLYSVLPKEPVENVNTLSDVLIERYRKILDTPYAAYLHEQQQKDGTRNTTIVVSCVVVLLLSLVFIWRGAKYTHRKFRGLSYGFGMAGVGFLVAALFDLVMKRQLNIEPAAYRSLFEHYLLWCRENILYFGILLVGISVFTWGAAYVTKRNHFEKLGLK